MFKSIYYYIDKFNRDEIYKLNRTINIIYRNYSNRFNKKEILQLVTFCKKHRRKVYISNNLKLALRFNFDGVYIPAFNKTLNYKNISKKNFEIIGSAHNLIQIKNKEKQDCKSIFITPLFKTKKSNYFLDTARFNLLAKNTKKKVVALGGINRLNYKRLKSTKIDGFASISWIKKNRPKNIGRFLK